MSIGTTVNRSGGGGAALARSDVAVATASINSGDTDEGSWDIGYLSALLLIIESDAEGSLSLYVSQDALDNDVRSFPPATDPTPGAGVLADFTFGSPGERFEVSPPVSIYSDEAPPTTFVFFRFYRAAAGTGLANIDMTIIGLEA